MLYLLLAFLFAVCGFAWARFASPATITGFAQFSNAAGILTRVLTVFDAIRQVAEWFGAGANGGGPLGVPVPAKNQSGAVGAQTQPQKGRFAYAPSDQDDADLPPRMVAPAAVV